ncbi:MAG: urease accessory protein UreF [Candidatus Tumulicola sp.]
MTSHEQRNVTPLSLIRLQAWLSPAFPIGSFSYSHGLEWAVEAGHVRDRQSLVDWLEADLLYGSARNEAFFFYEAWCCTVRNDRATLLEIAELAAAFRATSEFARESFQQAAACLATLQKVWPDQRLGWLSEVLRERNIQPVLAVVLGIRGATQCLPVNLVLPAFLQSYIANLVIAGVRLIPLGQTDGQCALAELEKAVLAASADAEKTSVDDLGSAAFTLDLASVAHETQYTRLFRS